MNALSKLATEFKQGIEDALFRLFRVHPWLKRQNLYMMRKKFSNLCYTQQHSEALISLVEYLLGSSTHQFRAILILHFIGPQQADFVFKRLSSKGQNRVSALLKDPAFRAPEDRLIHHVGWQLIDSLSQEHSIFHNRYFPIISQTLNGCSKRMLLEAFLKMPIQAIPRFCLYLTNTQMKWAYDQVAQSSPSRYRNICKALKRVEESQFKEELDPIIYGFITTMQNKI